MLNPDVTTVWNYRSSYVKKTLDELKEYVARVFVICPETARREES